MFIGEVAKKTGLSIKAIRLYEERGLISPSRQGRYRVYNDVDLETLKLIVEVKVLGVTLSQLEDVIQYQDGQVDWQRIGQFLIQVKAQMIEEREKLTQKINQLEECIHSIDTCPSHSIPCQSPVVK